MSSFVSRYSLASHSLVLALVIMPTSTVRDEDEVAVDFMDRVEYAVIDLPK